MQGVPVIVYVASNDSSNVDPDANWILNPDTHDPFDLLGPNVLRGFIACVGVLTLGAAIAWYLADDRTRRRAASAH